MNRIELRLLTLLLVVLGTSESAHACNLALTKTELPLEGQSYHQGLCLSDYFAKRDLARFSLVEDDHDLNIVKIVRDEKQMSFGEMFLFELANQTEPLGTTGRLNLVREIYSAHVSNLKNEFGTCQLEFGTGNRPFGIDDFIAKERSANEQPGSRLILTKDDVADPYWKLTCPSSKGSSKIEKQGKYFFVFIDVYERTSTKLKGHLANFLFSFR